MNIPSVPGTRYGDLGNADAVRVWDLPTRMFHWALATDVIGLLTTGFTGELVEREQLIRPMESGDQALQLAARASSGDEVRSRLFALGLFVACAVFAVRISSWRA